MLLAKLMNVPFLVLGSATLAFGGWIAYEAVSPTAQPPQIATSAVGTGDSEPHGPPIESVLMCIHPGCSRFHAEEQLSRVFTVQSDPVDLSAGVPVMRSRYLVSLNRPIPHLMPRVPPPMFKPGPFLLTLEFDGSRPGHPLVRAELKPE